MHDNTMIYYELKELNSLLATISNENKFTVPAGYFASLEKSILINIKNDLDIEIPAVPLLNRNVPEGYFEGLSDSIMHKIKMETHAESLPGFLSALSRKNNFTVPEGYFNSLSENILSKLPPTPAKVVAIKPRSSFFKYAVAAAITGILGLSLFSMFDKKTGSTISPSASVALAPIDQALITAGNILKNNSFDENMGALEDDDIINYLQKNGEDVNAALVASVTDEKNLPNEDAYFTDEKTLDNFLNEQHIVQTNSN